MPRLRLLPDVTTIYSEQKAAEVLEYLMRRGGALAIDTETTGLDLLRDRVIFWSMATESERYFIPMEYLLRFDPLFRRRDLTWYYANAKFDLHMLKNMGVDIRGYVHDIIVMDAMEDDTRNHGLKDQTRQNYDIEYGDFKDLFLKADSVAENLGLDKASFTRFKQYDVGEKLRYMYDENPRVVENYASCDAFFTYMRAVDLEAQLSAIPCATDMVPGLDTLYDYFRIIEVPFTRVLWKMERVGVPVDLERVKQLDIPMREGIRAREKRLRELLGNPRYNVRSDAELRALLYTKDGFNLAPVAFTTSGKTPIPSVAEKDLQQLMGRVPNRRAYEVIKAVLEYRHFYKLHSTFVAKIQENLGPDGRIHSRYNQSGARTGRLSSSDPNLQNIPIRNDEFKIRSMFVAPRGMMMLDCDYPQIQPRLAAVFANETKLLEAIRAGWDIHSANAANMFGPRDERVTYKSVEGARLIKEKDKSQLTDLHKALLRFRDQAKTVGLGVLFGEGPLKMGHQLDIPTQAASALIDQFFQTYPSLKRLIDDTHEECHSYGYAWTMLGRIRRLHMINQDLNFGKMKSEERQGFNHKIQGSEAEVMKLAMLQIDAHPDWNALGGQLAMSVHDELVSFAPEENAELALEVKTAIMADPLQWDVISLKLPVPVDPDGQRGRNWAEAH